MYGIKTNYYNLSVLYKNINDYMTSLEYYRKYSDYKDSIFNIESSGQIKEMQTKYETEQKNELTDSIEYAKTLQNAILPSGEEIKNYLPEHFIYFKPRDIVSGDFYWFHQHNGKIFISAIDCTGHGVPGAFVSMIGYNLLNKIVIENEISNPGKILTLLNMGIKDAFSRRGALARAQDGMDMAFCVFDTEKQKLSFAGAYNPLVHIRNNELNIIKPDKTPIGGYTKYGYEFQTFEVSVQKNDVFYIFSDGYYDQFGGAHGKKFMITTFRELLLSIHEKNMNRQMEVLDNTINEWIGDLSQIDDILVMGFSI